MCQPGRSKVLAGDRQLLLEERDVRLHVRAVHGELHQPAQQVVVGRRRHHAATVAEADQRVEGHRADGLLLLGRQPSLRRLDQRGVEPQVVAEQAGVPGDVDQRRQQGRQLGLFERGPQLGRPSQ